ncbi:MAG: bifunctional 4-hydroxy-2-oxoglutarate aldolase/2-dehydro-3-deoxy-phosphogluconate aldolase, partial [Chloroflexota bacterium]|nr:bifunctional 4-hydroxy-2-oxoglutarate aldolase/2-dehydro-3-deoxy-phosphogluconate aldolase [Chloroflexota bacterium]
DVIEPLTETVISSGLRTVEITMNTRDAPSLIRQMVKSVEGRITIGAGTVLTMEGLKAALDAGATFIVLPTLVPDVVEYCVSNAIPVFPGALTPQEVLDAWSSGATMVKVFPAGLFGPEYFKELKGPFPEIDFMACGGVNSGNIRTFFECGASAIAFGGSVFRQDWLHKREFSRIGKCIEELIGGFEFFEKSS